LVRRVAGEGALCVLRVSEIPSTESVDKDVDTIGFAGGMPDCYCFLLGGAQSLRKYDFRVETGS
jgi:hypothetical protein